jgi:hypothetical protein
MAASTLDAVLLVLRQWSSPVLRARLGEDVGA